MPRSVSNTLKQAVFAQETDQVFLFLLTISHPDLASPIRVCDDQVNLTSRGNLFVAFPFELELPEDSDAIPEGRLRIDNVDRQIVEAVRSISSAPTVLIEIVRVQDQDTVEVALPAFELREVTYDAVVVEGRLRPATYETEPYPARTFTPADWPGLF